MRERRYHETRALPGLLMMERGGRDSIFTNHMTEEQPVEEIPVKVREGHLDSEAHSRG